MFNGRIVGDMGLGFTAGGFTEAVSGSISRHESR